MEFPHIGQNCFVCNRNDYLPFKCSYCDKIVCVDHKNNHGNECPLNVSSFSADDDNFKASDSAVSSDLKQSCDFCRKITLKLELTRCSGCDKNFCLYHRHQAQHSCPQLEAACKARKIEDEERVRRQNEALNKMKDKITIHTPSVFQPKRIKDLDPKKKALARRVRVMKIKQFAKGPPNILPEDKIYFEVRFVHEPSLSISDASKDGSTLRIFTTKIHTVGRMVDWSAEEFKLTNKNNISGVGQLVFKIEADDESYITLDNQCQFVQYLDNNQLVDGDEILLTYQN